MKMEILQRLSAIIVWGGVTLGIWGRAVETNNYATFATWCGLFLVGFLAVKFGKERAAPVASAPPAHAEEPPPPRCRNIILD